MPQNTQLEMISAEAAHFLEAPARAADLQALRVHAAELASRLVPLPARNSSRFFAQRCKQLKKSLQPLLMALDTHRSGRPVSDDFRWLHDNVRLLSAAVQDIGDVPKTMKEFVQVRTSNHAVLPRIMAVAEGFLAASGYRLDEQGFTAYVDAFQESTVLKVAELWALVPCLKLVLLERIAVRGPQLLQDREGIYGVGDCIRSLHDVVQTSWKEALEPLFLVDRVLGDDPTGAYSKMEPESRDLYRSAVANIAKYSGRSEMDVAIEALSLARNAKHSRYIDVRRLARCSHVGYYLIEEGRPLLQEATGYQPPFSQRLQVFLTKHPDAYYLAGIQVFTVIILSIILAALSESSLSLLPALFAIFALFLPCSQSAIELLNYLTTSLLPPHVLPKLDFSEGIPNDCLTMVAVPALLLDEQQIHKLVEDLEVRYLGNRDSNLHFALLTDLPDCKEPAREDDPLVDLCAELIRKLNEKYAEQGMGSFFLLHRHRIYDSREGVWMGWERKRGKLLDLNKLLRHQWDSFPVKVGDLSILPRVRFVITLDSDTELPRGSAHRLVGALAHPLNQAIIDPEKNIVITGHAILQPRVGVSVHSAARSRLANIYSGQTGLDIYTKAVSDVYQDLYGEAIFTGKGIYEVDSLHQVLDHRFPQNALLSHDLIEGAYGRAGLASDIEVIDDYPSHYSAYNRRKHRWLRGDWQIAEWLLPRVLDESGNRVPNPISLISRWKILDNLRRSLVEPATFMLLLLGWLILPGSPQRWTVATLLLLFLPAWFQFVFALVRAIKSQKIVIARDGLTGFFAANVNVFLKLIFLAHQTLLSLDAIVRALGRRLVTGRRLLEWETAAEAELGTRRRNPIDTYLDWTPAVAVGSGLLILSHRAAALVPAIPILLLWGCSRLISQWLNRPPRAVRYEASEQDRQFLRRTALRTWRYFAELSNQEHNWLIPDNLQEEPSSVAARISPTNVSFLLNARQVACEFGYLTSPEFADLTLRTLESVAKLPKYRGHLLNWYDTRTLEPLAPLFVSSADSGNLIAALWSLQQGCLERLRRPILQPALLEGLLDHLLILGESNESLRELSAQAERQLKGKHWLQHMLEPPETVLADLFRFAAGSENSVDLCWFAKQAHVRLESLQHLVASYTPWLLPEFSWLLDDQTLNLRATAEKLLLEQLPSFIDTLSNRLQVASSTALVQERPLYQALEVLLPAARENAMRLVQDLETIAATAGRFANEMDFKFLFKPRRKLLSVGFNIETRQLHPGCYDLLASEARTAVFAAIAKGDIPQDAWFVLGRAHTLDHGRPVLLSWTGTMFEYLLPALWMRTYPNTLLERSRLEAVRSQQAYTARKRIPWGISESAYFGLDEAGNYQYHAFGLPRLAVHKDELEALVVSPYSSLLALHVDASDVLRNLRKMTSMGWVGKYGFYEAADYTPSTGSARRDRYELIRCWMVHHQGMSLLAIANFLHSNVVQRWFHDNPRVQATELLLQEKPVTDSRKLRATMGAAAA